MGWLRLFVLTSALAILCAAPATGQQCQAPPGTAAVDEYCETIPSSTGGEGAGSGGSASPRPAPRSTARALEKAGEDGRGLSRFLAQDPNAAPAAEGRKPGDLSSDRGAAGSARTEARAKAEETPSDQEASSNPLRAIRSAVGSGDTVGDGFVWVILAMIVVMGGLGWVRYRRQATP
jgi:hypothetical protein